MIFQLNGVLKVQFFTAIKKLVTLEMQAASTYSINLNLKILV
jgi:hypothetical protein